MSDPCPTCFPVQCPDTGDPYLYSLESPLYPFTFSCPPGYDCNDATSLSMVCCGKLLITTFDPSATLDQKLSQIQELLNQCAVRQVYCGDIPSVPTNPPTILYFSSPQTCSAACPNGTIYTFSLPAGAFAALSQSEANSNAKTFACIQATLRRICLGEIQTYACVGTVYSSTIIESGGVGPFVWSVDAGSVPTGMSFHSGNLSGTPTTGGTYTFEVKITSLSDGSISKRTYTICVIDISPSSATLPTANIGTAYTSTFSATACAGTGLTWSVVLGTLPPGLHLDPSTGVLSGTPTTAGSYMFTVQLVAT